MKMPDPAEKLGKDRLNDGTQLREDSEYVRLVISNEPRGGEGYTLQPQAEKIYESSMPLFTLCSHGMLCEVKFS